MTVSTISIDAIEIDEGIYPRKQRSQKTIDSYTQALESGASFPPILIQEISDNGKNKTICLDGVHRIGAFRQAGIDQISAEFWMNEILDREDHLKDLRIQSIKSNLTHGDRLSNRDKERMCQVLAEADVDGMIKQEEFATIFAVPQRTVSDWIGPIRARQKGSRDNLIYRLSFLGWTQQEIADSLGLTQQAVSAVTKNSDFAKICNGFKAGKSIDELAQFHGLEHIVVWRIILDSLSDMGRFEKFHEQKPSPFNVWMFAERDKRLGQIATGNIPGQIVTHLLYYYTQPNNLIVDPMAGGGSTIDACLMMGRKCRAYDLNPQRDDILKRDINNGFPTRAKNCDLIFLDPPYYNMVFDLYDDIDDFYAFVRRLAESCLETVRVDGHVAFLIQDMTEKGTYCLSGESYRIFIEAGFEYVDHISAPLTSNVEHYTRDEDERKLVGRNRDLYIFRRPGP